MKTSAVIGLIVAVAVGVVGVLIWAKAYENKFIRGLFALRMFANTLSRIHNTKH